jgi:hypothetical protein
MAHIQNKIVNIKKELEELKLIIEDRIPFEIYTELCDDSTTLELTLTKVLQELKK